METASTEKMLRKMTHRYLNETSDAVAEKECLWIMYSVSRAFEANTFDTIQANRFEHCTLMNSRGNMHLFITMHHLKDAVLWSWIISGGVCSGSKLDHMTMMHRTCPIASTMGQHWFLLCIFYKQILVCTTRSVHAFRYDVVANYCAKYLVQCLVRSRLMFAVTNKNRVVVFYSFAIHSTDYDTVMHNSMHTKIVHDSWRAIEMFTPIDRAICSDECKILIGIVPLVARALFSVGPYRKNPRSPLTNANIIVAYLHEMLCHTWNVLFTTSPTMCASVRAFI